MIPSTTVVNGQSGVWSKCVCLEKDGGREGLCVCVRTKESMTLIQETDNKWR